MVMVWFRCSVLFAGVLLHEVSLLNRIPYQRAVCAGPGGTLLVACVHPISLLVFNWSGQLQQIISVNQLQLKQESWCRGVGWGNGRLLLNVWEDGDEERLYSYTTK